ncbi:hypothetical protein BDA99DRAFT_512771 [Phascolomyces articulosus]|uniref:Zn(2)-C6 fungal-type domain-containing protein n=1 Tax=Phascolomyces articulosus TaxID=60185 RepID=A0AAD5JYT8_9FUNG|nr:hypothetical protein BDA99DRAFT_512771 [Phascolomyces articulosus]
MLSQKEPNTITTPTPSVADNLQTLSTIASSSSTAIIPSSTSSLSTTTPLPISNTNTATTTSRPSNKSHVLRACVNCRKAHLACDTDRPCKRCVSLGKEQTCYDVDHKKRGRPKLRPNGQRVQKNVMTTPIRQSSFSMTNNANNNYLLLTQTYTSPIITAFLSMEICCARVSDEVQHLLGYYPQELAHRPLFSFIAPRSSETLARLHRVLLDNVTHVAQKVDPAYQRMPPTERTTSDKFFSQHPDTLTVIANGSQTVADTLWVKRNDGQVEPLTAQFYLGGGLGADLYTPSTLSSLYIVCLLSRPVQAQQIRPQQVSLPQSQQQSQPPSSPSEQQQQSNSPSSDNVQLTPSSSNTQQQHPTNSSTSSSQQPLQQQQLKHQPQQRLVALRQGPSSNNNSNSNNTNTSHTMTHDFHNANDQPVLLTHPSSSSIPLRAPWQQVHVAPINNKKDSKSNSTIDYVKQSMRLFQTTAEPSRSSNMSVDALLS